MAANARLDGAQIDFGRFAQAAEQVVGGLGIVDGARKGLKAEQADGLLMKLVHGARGPTRWPEAGPWRPQSGPARPAAAAPAAGQGQRRRMSGNDGRGKEIDGGSFSPQPGGAHQHACLLIERAGKIEDRGAGAERGAPVAAGQVFAAAEKGEVGVIEGVGGNGLDEGDLVAHLVELALGFLFIEQDKVGGSERRIGEDSFSSRPTRVEAPAMAILYTASFLLCWMRVSEYGAGMSRQVRRTNAETGNRRPVRRRRAAGGGGAARSRQRGPRCRRTCRPAPQQNSTTLENER